MSDNGCCYCGTVEKELRPYGPEGKNVCFRCAMETPERVAEAENQLAQALGEAGPVATLTSAGPVPFVQSSADRRGAE
jgi:hypothetical protein